MLSIIFFLCIMIVVIEMEYKITSYNERDTATVAENLESEKFPNMVICLMGDLGSGKTIFTKAFAKATGIEEEITSPTFNIIIEDYFNKGGVTIIEWADMIRDKLPEERLEIKFKVIDENTRVLKLIPYGKVYEDICGAIS